jgi:hypothetical protein
MAKLYRKEILQEPDAPAGFVAIGEIGGLGSNGNGIKPAAPRAEVVSNIEETVAGD